MIEKLLKRIEILLIRILKGKRKRGKFKEEEPAKTGYDKKGKILFDSKQRVNGIPVRVMGWEVGDNKKLVWEARIYPFMSDSEYDLAIESAPITNFHGVKHSYRQLANSNGKIRGSANGVFSIKYEE